MARDYRHGGAFVGVMLTAMILGALAIAALVSAGAYIADNVHVSECDNRGETVVETPFGSVTLHENHRVGPQYLGVPIYPGAVRERDSNALTSVHFDFGHAHGDFAVAAAAYRTPDSVAVVTDFYRAQLHHWLISQREDGGVQLSLTKRGYRTMVVICDDGGETRIALASVGEPAAN